MEQKRIIQGTYEIIKEIGAGSGGTVFLAYHNRLQKNVVLKKMKSEAKKIFDIRAETDILKNLHHAYIPQVFDFVQDIDEDGNEVIYTVMDFITGKSFEDYLKEGRTFTPTQVAKYMSQLCEAVEYLHAQNPPIIHGDIKPGNVMLTPDDNICLIDFNVSGFSDDLEILAFTRGYASPEQVQAAMDNRKRRKSSQVASDTVVRPQAARDADKTDVDDDKTVIDEDKTVIDDDKTVIDDDKTVIDEDKTVIDEDKTVIDDDKTVIDDDKTIVDNDKTEVSKTTGMPIATVGNMVAFERVTMIDHRADIYSVGATMYRLLTGTKPDAEYVHTVPVEKMNLDVSEGLAFAIDKSMSLKPEKRFQTAKEMRKALNNLGKKDKRYKRLVARQTLFCIFFIVCAAASAVTAALGYKLMQSEKLDVYYNTSVQLYQEQNYSGALEYIVTEALEDISIYDRGTLGNLYYLAAESSFELGEYDASVSFYEQAILCNSSNAEYYCNYAIALSRMGQTDKALEIIDLATQKGVAEDQIYLMHGELQMAQMNLTEALKSFRACISCTKDDYVLARAYVKCSDAFSQTVGYTADSGLVLQNVQLLTEASQIVIDSYKPLILERLIEADCLLSDLTGDTLYKEYAIAEVKKMINLGWGTFDMYLNLALLYDDINMYEESYSVYQQMLTSFGENYQIYKRMAFLTLELQGEYAVEERNYDDFKKYYDKACELFETAGKRKDQDTEMQLLQESYNTLVDGGWFD